jgi:hypothetical protein
LQRSQNFNLCSAGTAATPDPDPPFDLPATGTPDEADGGVEADSFEVDAGEICAMIAVEENRADP